MSHRAFMPIESFVSAFTVVGNACKYQFKYLREKETSNFRGLPFPGDIYKTSFQAAETGRKELQYTPFEGRGQQRALFAWR